jgi:hypothetical protein
MDTEVIRTDSAPTEAEARAMAAPLLDAFRAAGWQLREDIWIPGDRRPGLGESLLLSPKSEQLLEADGTLRLSFANPDPDAIAPSTGPAARHPDTFESIGGVRYRRLVPRWSLALVVGAIGLVLFLSFASTMSVRPFAPAPTPVNGICPPGWMPGMHESNGTLVPDGTCVEQY